MPPMKLRKRRSSNGSRRRQLAPFWQSQSQRKRGDGEHIGDQVPFRRSRRRFRSGGGRSAGERHRMKTLPRGVRTMSTPPRCSSMLSAHAMPYRAPVMVVNGLRTCSPSFIPTSEGRSSVGARQRSGGDLSTNRTRSHRSSGSSSCSRVSPHWEKSVDWFA